MLLPFQCLQRYAKTNRNTLQRFDRNNCRQYYSHHVPSAHKQPISHDDIINAERIPWRKCETVSCWRTVEFSCEQFSRTLNQNIRFQSAWAWAFAREIHSDWYAIVRYMRKHWRFREQINSSLFDGGHYGRSIQKGQICERIPTNHRQVAMSLS